MSSPEEALRARRSFKVTDKYLDRDKAREKARLVEIFKNEVALSIRFASLGDSDMAWFHRRLGVYSHLFRLMEVEQGWYQSDGNKVLSQLPPAIGLDVEFVLVDKGEGKVVTVPHVSEDRQVHF